MKKRTNIFDRLISLKLSTKILLLFIYIIISFSFVLFKSNIYNIRHNVNGVENIYDNISKKTDNGYNLYTIKFESSKVKRLFIEYNSDKEFDLQLDYSLFDNEKIYEVSDLDECSQYSSINVYNVKNLVNTINIKVPEYVSIDDVYINNNYTFDMFFFCLLIVIMIVSIGMLYIYNKGYEKIHILFSIMYISFGIFFVISTPPAIGASWDDQIHFKNTIETIHFNDYEKTDAEDVLVGVKTRFYFYDHIEEQIDYMHRVDELDKNIQLERNNKNIITYTSLAYLPGSIIYNALKTVGVSFSLRFNLVRIVSIIMYAMIFTYAIKIAKKYKLLLFVTGLIPEGLFIASNYNYDAFIFSFSILGFVSFINMLNSEKVGTKDLITFVISITLASLTKVIYGPLFLLLFLIPNNKFSSTRTAKLIKGMILLITFFVMSTFLIPVLFSNVSMNDSRGGSNVNIAMQIKYIINNPVSSCLLFFKNIFGNYFSYTVSSNSLLFFAYRGSNNSELYFLIVTAFIFAFLEACQEKNNSKIFSKFFIELIVFCIISGTWLILYLTFNNVGSSSIGGVQPRYFMPLIIYMIYPLITNKISYKSNKRNTLLIITIIYLIIYMLIFIEKYFYYL